MPIDDEDDDDRPRRRRRDEDDDEDDRPRSRRRDQDDEDDDRPRRRRRDDDDEDDRNRPARPVKKGGCSRVLVVLLIVAGVGVVLCAGGIGACIYFMPKQVEVLDATRTKSPEGGTSSVTVNLRVGAPGPGGMVRGDYYFMFKSGTRTSVHNFGLMGHAGGEFKHTFATPELSKEPGPVEFWVERRDGDSVSRVSEVRTIP